MLQLSEQALEHFDKTHLVARRILLIYWKFRFQFFSGLNHHTPSPISRVESKAMAPLPGVVRQPAECGELARTFSRTQTCSQKAFAFSCCSSSHFLTPHYMNLPSYLPHQDHSCPPCQMEEYRAKADRDAINSAKTQFPHLTSEMLVRNGRVWEDWQTKPTLENFVEERRVEERQMWFHVTRKWTQDLKKGRVLISEEDGLGLLG